MERRKPACNVTVDLLGDSGAWVSIDSDEPNVCLYNEFHRYVFDERRSWKRVHVQDSETKLEASRYEHITNKILDGRAEKVGI